MAASGTDTETFAEQLRRALDEQDVSVRELARRLNPQTPESARSAIHKWLRSDHMPHRSSQRAVAVALGFQPDYFRGVVPPFGQGETAMLDVLIAALVRAREVAAA